jgi:hypothetical protein
VTLFPKRGSEAKSDEKPVTAPIVADQNGKQQISLEEAASLVPKVVTVSLSAEQMSLLDQPLDPRVDRILQTINDGKIAEERLVSERRIIRLPRADEQRPAASEPDPIAALGEL